MDFGTASIGLSVDQLQQFEAPATEQPPQVMPARGILYDCGRHGSLTALEIARIAGTSKTAIYKRINTGTRGEALCVRRWANQSNIRRDAPPRRHSLVLAIRIAHQFPDRLPEIWEIKKLRAMSDKNAQIWRQAIATARKAAGR